MFKKRGVQREYRGLLGEKKLLIGITTLVGTIVGAGILGIPYVIAKAGLLYGSVLIVGIGLAFLLLNLSLGEVVLRTREQHQLTGYAEKYLGKKGKILMFCAMVVNIYGALTAYLIGEGKTLHTLIGLGSPLLYSLFFFIAGSWVVYRGIKATGRMELFLIGLLFVVVLFIGIFSINKISADNFSVFNPAFFFLPYGVVIFAFMASPGVPEVHEELGRSKEKIKKAIIIGSIIPIVLYLVFTVIIVGIVGLDNFEALSPNERIATVALSLYSSSLLGILANVLAVLTMFTSYLALGTALMEMYHYDYKFSRRVAFLMTVLLPLFIVILDVTHFIRVLGITGAIAGGLDGTLVLFMFWRAKKRGDRVPEYSLKPHYVLGGLLIILFATGMIHQLWMQLG